MVLSKVCIALWRRGSPPVSCPTLWRVEGVALAHLNSPSSMVRSDDADKTAVSGLAFCRHL